MNYLAHAYLSFQQPGLLIGNMISDFVKGKKQYDYPPPIFKGIKLHRAIDDFTDTHEATKAAKDYFRKDYRLYAGAVMDVIYDHYLATDETIFPAPLVLQQHAQSTYSILRQNIEHLPERFRQMLPYMQKQDWLSNYRSRLGIERSLAGLVSRSAYLDNSEIAFQIFEANYEELRQCYNAFFPALRQMAEKFLIEWEEPELLINK